MSYIKIYQHAMSILRPVWRGMSSWRVRCKKENPAFLPQRFGVITKARPDGPLMWFHAASIGESRAALSMISKLLEDWPSLWILLTAQTLGALRALASSLPPRVIHQMAPYDVPSYVNRFLDHWAPQAFCVLEAEMWPYTWHAVHERQIPMFLFNFHISAKSFERWSYLKSFFEENYKLFQERWTGCSDSYKRFCQLTSLPMTLMPSLKYASPCLEVKSKEDQLNLALRPFWMASCVHAAEEDLILSVHARLQKTIPNLLLIYAPRHFDRVGILEANYKNIQRSSEIFQPQSTSNIYLIDTVGELGALYKMAPFVVLCGSFCDVGGHNLIEPTLLDCAVIHGPNMSNQRDIANHFHQHQAALQVRSEDLYESVLNWILHPELAQMKALRARKILDQSQREVVSIIHNFSQTLNKKISMLESPLTMRDHA